MEPPLCVVSNWIIRVYTILIWNTISGSSNLDICCYHCLILTLIFHLKVLINFFFFLFIIIIIITIIVVVIVLLLTIIYTINLPVIRPRSCRVIYYFDTPTLGRRHQSFGRVRYHWKPSSKIYQCKLITWRKRGLHETFNGVSRYLRLVLRWNVRFFPRVVVWLVLKSAFLSKFYIIILHLKYQ